MKLHQEYGHILLRVVPLRLEWQNVEYHRDAMLDFTKVYNADRFGAPHSEMFCYHRGSEKLWFLESQLEKWVELNWFSVGSWKNDISMVH